MTPNKKISRDLKKACDQAIHWAVSAGKITAKYQRKIDSLKVSRKKALGVVSEADIASENFLLTKIRKAYKGDAILAEESDYARHGGNPSDYSQYEQSPWCWALDPLDGTTNFLNGMDYYCIAISLLHYGRPVMGVVYRPPTGECFYGFKGGGSFHVNLKDKTRPRRLKQSVNRKQLRDSLLVTGFAGEKGQKFLEEFDYFKKLVQSTRGVRRMGSAALDLCYVARGTFDGFWESGLAPWDVAASGIICLESGVEISDYKGLEFSPFKKSIIAARSPFFKNLLNFVGH